MLEKRSVVFVQWQTQTTRHERAFAVEATDQDDGKGLGILVSTRVDSKECQTWLTRKGRNAVRIADTLYDLLTDRIVGKDYQWTADRPPIFNGRYWRKKTKEDSNAMHKKSERALVILLRITDFRLVR